MIENKMNAVVETKAPALELGSTPEHDATGHETVQRGPSEGLIPSHRASFSKHGLFIVRALFITVALPFLPGVLFSALVDWIETKLPPM